MVTTLYYSSLYSRLVVVLLNDETAWLASIYWGIVFMADIKSNAAQISFEIAQNDPKRASTSLAEAYIELTPKDFRALVNEMEKNESKNKIDISSSFSDSGITVKTAGSHSAVLLQSFLPKSNSKIPEMSVSKTEKFAQLLKPQDHPSNEIAARALMNVAFRMPPEQGRNFLEIASQVSLSRAEENNMPYLRVSSVDINKDGKSDNLGRVEVHTPPTKLPGISNRQPGGAFLSIVLDSAASVGTGSTTLFEYDFSSGTKWPPFNRKPSEKAQVYNPFEKLQKSR